MASVLIPLMPLTALLSEIDTTPRPRSPIQRKAPPVPPPGFYTQHSVDRDQYSLLPSPGLSLLSFFIMTSIFITLTTVCARMYMFVGSHGGDYCCSHDGRRVLCRIGDHKISYWVSLYVSPGLWDHLMVRWACIILWLCPSGHWFVVLNGGRPHGPYLCIVIFPLWLSGVEWVSNLVPCKFIVEAVALLLSVNDFFGGRFNCTVSVPW